MKEIEKVALCVLGILYAVVLVALLVWVFTATADAAKPGGLPMWLAKGQTQMTASVTGSSYGATAVGGNNCHRLTRTKVDCTGWITAGGQTCAWIEHVYVSRKNIIHSRSERMVCALD